MADEQAEHYAEAHADADTVRKSGNHMPVRNAGGV